MNKQTFPTCKRDESPGGQLLKSAREERNRVVNAIALRNGEVKRRFPSAAPAHKQALCNHDFCGSPLVVIQVTGMKAEGKWVSINEVHSVNNYVISDEDKDIEARICEVLNKLEAPKDHLQRLGYHAVLDTYDRIRDGLELQLYGLVLELEGTQRLRRELSSPFSRLKPEK